jgi:hypothetical protein
MRDLMNMDEYVKMWKDISEGKEVKVPAQLHLDGEMTGIIRVLGEVDDVYEYFKKVRDAEAPTTQ